MAEKFTNINSDYSALQDLTRFHGFYDNNIYRDPFVGGNAFIFVTKPLLFIDYDKSTGESLAYLNMTRDPVFSQYLVDQQFNKMDRKLVELLSYNVDRYYSGTNFLPMFTNQCKSFDSNDSVMEQMDAFDTKQGYRQPLPSHKSASEAMNTLSFNVTEDSNLSFTKLLTLWVNYISNITDGTFDANPEMILNGALDYMCSIYYFVLSPDGRTIKYYCKYTGCWPTTIPYSALRYDRANNDVVDISVPFVYTIKEDMNPKILEEFNILSLNLVGTDIQKFSVNGMYSSIKKSPLLNKSDMLTYLPNVENRINAENRDPIVFYVSGNDRNRRKADPVYNDALEDHFELIFDNHGYKSEFIESVFGEDLSDNLFDDEADSMNVPGERYDVTSTIRDELRNSNNGSGSSNRNNNRANLRTNVVTRDYM